jgi:hypothetical protein
MGFKRFTAGNPESESVLIGSTRKSTYTVHEENEFLTEAADGCMLNLSYIRFWTSSPEPARGGCRGFFLGVTLSGHRAGIISGRIMPVGNGRFMAKQSQRKFMKRQKESDRMRKAKEKMDKRQGKIDESKEAGTEETTVKADKVEPPEEP